jgi:hypothetical protein
MGQPVPLSDLPSGTPVPDEDLLDAQSPTGSAQPPKGSAPTAANFRVSNPIDDNPVSNFIQGYSKTTLGGAAGAIGGGVRGLWDLALGRGSAQAASDVEATEQAARSGIMTPKNPAEAAGAEAAASPWNPLNWPGVALSWTGKKLGSLSESLGGSPLLSAGLETAPTTVAALYSPVKGALSRDWSPYKVPAEEVPPAGSSQSISAAAVGKGALPQGAPEPLGAPIEGGLPQEAHDARAQTLARVGLSDARQSAITGDAKDAAVDYQMTKYDQPAGRAAAAQFEAERDALAAHTENLIGNAGGTVGMDEDALANRGATIAQPFDMLRQWFSDRTKQLYTQADARAGGAPITDLGSVDQLIESPSFRNTLMAKDQQGLLSAVKGQMENFRETNPDGFNAQGAEQVRQWLNQVWTPDNKWAVGQLKNAIDKDVLSGAGEDIYSQARAIHQLRATTLDDPRGVSQLFDTDPNTPINRSTALEKIPDKLAQLPIDQFSNVLRTLQGMPDELQPEAQAALGEIKSHLLNKVLQAGTQTSRGVGAQVWGTDRVSQILRTNAAKFRTAFSGNPDAQAGIEDLSNAGQILKVDQSYPGADAQAANAMKRGLISRTLGHLGGMAGAAAGGSIAGPIGAAVGGAGGESLGLTAGAKAAESSALKAWNKRVRSTGDAQ